MFSKSRASSCQPMRHCLSGGLFAPTILRIFVERCATCCCPQSVVNADRPAVHRRRRRRVSLHWPVRLFRQTGRPLVEVVESNTENLSSEGLYCITQELFKQGEHLQCMIVIPETVGGLESPILLECQVTIRRVENLRHGFGLGCHIEDYSLGTPHQPCDWCPSPRQFIRKR